MGRVLLSCDDSLFSLCTVVPEQSDNDMITRFPRAVRTAALVIAAAGIYAADIVNPRDPRVRYIGRFTDEDHPRFSWAGSQVLKYLIKSCTPCFRFDLDLQIRLNSHGTALQ